MGASVDRDGPDRSRIDILHISRFRRRPHPAPPGRTGISSLSRRIFEDSPGQRGWDEGPGAGRVEGAVRRRHLQLRRELPGPPRGRRAQRTGRTACPPTCSSSAAATAGTPCSTPWPPSRPESPVSSTSSGPANPADPRSGVASSPWGNAGAPTGSATGPPRSVAPSPCSVWPSSSSACRGACCAIDRSTAHGADPVSHDLLPEAVPPHRGRRARRRPRPGRRALGGAVTLHL